MYNDNYGNICILSNFQSKKKSCEGDKKPLSDTTHCQWESVIWKYRTGIGNGNGYGNPQGSVRVGIVNPAFISGT